MNFLNAARGISTPPPASAIDRPGRIAELPAANPESGPFDRFLRDVLCCAAALRPLLSLTPQ